MKLLDFSKMKKVATDGKTTTFKHEKGHTMTILHAVLPKIQQEQIKRIPLAEGGNVEPDDQSVASDKKPLEVESIPQAQAPASHDTHIIINAAPAPMQPQVQQTASPPIANGIIAPDQALNVPATVQKGATGLEQQAEVAGQTAQGQVPVEQQAMDVNQQRLQRNQENYNEFKSHADDFANYIKSNPIDSNHYLGSMDSDQKYKTGIGLFLGGLGGGGTSNTALDFLNRQIDRDIDAQKKNADNRATIWGAYEHLYNDSQIADNLTKVAMNDIVANQLRRSAAKLGTKQAQANLNLGLNKLGNESNQLLLNAAGRKGTLDTGMSPSGNQGIQQGTAVKGGILPADASARLNAAKFNPVAKNDYEQLKSQYNQAVQADKALAQIDDTFDTLKKNVAEGSVGGNLRRRGTEAVGSVPVIGQPIAGALKYITDTDANKAFDTNQSALLGYISSALKGTNIGGGQIEEIVNKNSPERGDSPQLSQQKLNAIKDFIKKHTDTSQLEQYGIVPKVR